MSWYYEDEESYITCGECNGEGFIYVDENGNEVEEDSPNCIDTCKCESCNGEGVVENLPDYDHLRDMRLDR